MKGFQASFCCISLLIATVVQCDWQFKSRPDLAPPRMNITIPANGTTPGFLFMAPFSGFPDIGVGHGPRQSAPYIFTDQGDLVWSGFTYFSTWAANFQAARVNGQDVLFSFEGAHNPNYGHGHGHWTFLNNRYETVRELRAGNHKISDKHEFHILNEKTAVLQVYQPIPADLSPWARTKEQQWIVNAIFQEVDIETGKVLFEWSSLDHVSPDESALSINEGKAGSGFNSSDAWDYFHINSVDKDENGDYLLSARHAASLFKIDGKTGDIIWKLGGLPGITSSDFELQGFNFSFQHHARYISTSPDLKKQVISIFDNSAYGTEDKFGNLLKYNSKSSGKIIEVNTVNRTAELLYNAFSPDELLTKSQGSNQVLPNGNIFVNWGSEGAVTEFDLDSNPIFHAHLDSGELGYKVQNYRAFRFNWTGFPNEDISLHTEYDLDHQTSLYVSWNGDTRTKTWRFYAIEKNGEKTWLGDSPRTSFETSLVLNQKITQPIIAEAHGLSNEILGASQLVTAVKAVYIASNDMAEQHPKESLEVKIKPYFEWRAQQSVVAL